MESFTIKYDIDDLLPKKQTNPTGEDDAPNNNNSTKNLVNSCICLRMARMFTDLLSKPEQNETQNSNNAIDPPQPNELKHIHKEIKTLRKYQFELNEKLNYIFAKLSSNSSSSSSANQAFKAPPSSNPLAKKQSKPQNPSPNSVQKASSSTSALLTGAKKRKFNSSSSKSSAYPNESAANFRSNASTPTSSNSSPVSSLVSDPKLIDYDDDDDEEHDDDEDENNNNNNNNNELEVNSASSNPHDECCSSEIKVEHRGIDLEMDDDDDDDDEENSNPLGPKEHSLTDLVESYASFRSAAPNGFRQKKQQQQQHQPEQHIARPHMHFNGNTSLSAPRYGYPNQRQPGYSHQNRGFSSNSNGSCSANQRVMAQKVEYKPLAQAQTQQQPVFDIDIDELFKGDGPKYLQLESYKNFKPPIALVGDKHHIDEHMAAMAYSKSKSRRNFAAHLTKLVFTPRERLESNCNGRFGKKALDSTRLAAIRNTLFKYYPCKQSTVILNGDKITSGDHDENNVWIRDCIPAIDESNRVLKKQLISWYKKNHNMKTIKAGSSYGSGGGGGGGVGGEMASTSGNASFNESLLGSQAYYGLNGGGYGLDEQDFDEDFEDNEGC